MAGFAQKKCSDWQLKRIPPGWIVAVSTLESHSHRSSTSPCQGAAERAGSD
jgi:hypothetical protein